MKEIPLIFKKIINFSPDIVYHLGEYSRVEQSFKDIEKVWEFNKNGIFSVLEFCRKKAQNWFMLVVVPNLAAMEVSDEAKVLMLGLRQVIRN